MSSSSPLSLDHLPSSDQLCYVRCYFCDTVLAVSVPCSRFSETVIVRCGHCTNLLSINMRGLLHLVANGFFPPSHNHGREEIPCPPPSLLLDQCSSNEPVVSVRGNDESPPTTVVNRRGGKKKKNFKPSCKGCSLS